MQQHAISHLPVLQSSQVIGLLTRRQIQWGETHVIRARQQAPGERPELRVGDVMTRQVVIKRPEASAKDAAQMMWEGGTGCILVMRGQALIGVVTQSDLLDVFLSEIEGRVPDRYEHFLVPTDFGCAAHQAMQTAQLLASRHQARITLLHVLPRLMHILATDIDHTSAESITTLHDTCKADSWNRLIDWSDACT